MYELLYFHDCIVTHLEATNDNYLDYSGQVCGRTFDLSFALLKKRPFCYIGGTNHQDIFLLVRYGIENQIDYKHLMQVIKKQEYKDAAIFADELLIQNNNNLQKLSNIVIAYEGRTIWLANTYIDNSVSIEEVKSKFEAQNFFIPELLNPVRNSKAIVRHAYPSMKGELIFYQRYSLHHYFNHHLCVSFCTSEFGPCLTVSVHLPKFTQISKCLYTADISAVPSTVNCGVTFPTVIWQYSELLMTVSCCSYYHQHP